MANKQDTTVKDIKEALEDQYKRGNGKRVSWNSQPVKG